MKSREIHLSYASGDTAEIAPLAMALARQKIDPNAQPDDCTLFLACCSSRGTYASDELQHARQRQLAEYPGRLWLVAVHFGPGPLPEAFNGLPVITFHDAWDAALTHLIALLPAKGTARSRTEIHVKNSIMAPDVLIENKPAGSSTEMSITAEGNIVGDNSVVFRNG